MTGKDFLTGVFRWFLFQNGNFQKVVETAAEARTRWLQPIWFNAAIVVKCVYLIQFAPTAGITRVKRSSTWVKRPRNNNITPRETTGIIARFSFKAVVKP